MLKIACVTSTPMTVNPSERSEPVEYRYSNPYPLTPADLEIADRDVMAAGLRALNDGCDAIIVNALADYGVDQLRTVVRGPVIGAGYASLAAAAQLARRFSMVSVWSPNTRWVWTKKLRDYGMLDACVSNRFVSSDEDLSDLDRRREIHRQIQQCDVHLVDRVRAEITRAVEDDGAEAVILGCSCMSAAALTLDEASPVPVIDPQGVAYDMAELLAIRHGPVELLSSHAMPAQRMVG